MPLSSATAASADKVTKITITKKVPIAILVDGPNFCGLNVKHFQLLENTIISRLEEKLAQDSPDDINTKFRVFTPPGSLHICCNDPQDDLERDLIKTDQCSAKQHLHYLLRGEDWQINLAVRKKVDGKWRGADDVLLAKYANDLSTPGFFEPIGTNRQRVTAEHLFIVSNDKDHLSTFKQQSPATGGNNNNNNESTTTLRHIVLTNGCNELEKAGDRVDRILRLYEDEKYMQELEQLRIEHRQQKKSNSNSNSTSSNDNSSSKSSSSQNVSFTSVSSSSESKTSLDDDDDDNNNKGASSPKTPPPPAKNDAKNAAPPAAAAATSTKTFAELAKTKAQQQETSSKNQQQKQQEQRPLIIIGPSPSDKKNKKGEAEKEKTAAKIDHEQYRPRYVPDKGLVDYKQYIIIKDKLVYRRDLSTTKGIEPFEEGKRELKTYSRWCHEGCSGNCSKGSDCWGAHPREGMSKKEVMANAKELPRDPSRVFDITSSNPVKNSATDTNTKTADSKRSQEKLYVPPGNLVDYKQYIVIHDKLVFRRNLAKTKGTADGIKVTSWCQHCVALSACPKGVECPDAHPLEGMSQNAAMAKSKDLTTIKKQEEEVKKKENLQVEETPDPENAFVELQSEDKKYALQSFVIPFKSLPRTCQVRFKTGKSIYVCTHFYDAGVCPRKKCDFVHISGGVKQKQEKEEETVLDANNLAFQHGLQLDSSINNNTATAVADASSTGKKKKKNKSSKKAEESFPVTENNNDDDDQQQQGTSSAAADLMDLLLKELEEN